MLVKPVTVSAGNIFVKHFSILVLLPSAFLNCPDQKQSLCRRRNLGDCPANTWDQSNISCETRTDDNALLPAG